MSAPSPQARRLPADARRAQILREAAQLFGSHGFNGTTTRDVAARVGITEAALYRYFPSKEAMYQAILDERMAKPDLFAPLESVAASGDDRAVFTSLALTLLQPGDHIADLLGHATEDALQLIQAPARRQGRGTDYLVELAGRITDRQAYRL